MDMQPKVLNRPRVQKWCVPAKLHRMDIRFAKKEDLPQIIELCREHAAYEGTEYDSVNKIELLSEFVFGQDQVLKCLVVEQINSIAGYATFMTQFSTWDAGFYLYLDCLFLRENSRGQGIGMLLIEEIKKYALVEKCNVIQWQTPLFNHEAISFYQKIGGISKTKERFCLNI